MIAKTNLGGSLTFANANTTVNRMGYGAMQLAGPQVWGPPRDPEEALKALREALDAGVNHIDTSDFATLPIRSSTRRSILTRMG